MKKPRRCCDISQHEKKLCKTQRRLVKNERLQCGFAGEFARNVFRELLIFGSVFGAFSYVFGRFGPVFFCDFNFARDERFGGSLTLAKTGHDDDRGGFSLEVAEL